MRKTDTSVNKKAKKTNQEVYRCGDCLHFQRHAHSGKDDLCVNQGVRQFAVAPKCFTPDVSILQGNTDTFLQLTMLLNAYTPKQRRIMLAVVRDAARVKRAGYTIGTEVFFRLSPGEYLNNYYSAFVMGRTSSGELMLNGSPDMKTRGDSFMMYMRPEEENDLRTRSAWKKHEQMLRDKGLINDPVHRRNRIKKTDEDDYQPPSIDSVPESWYSKTDREEKRAKGKKRTSKEFQVT